ncbi:molybdopterin molybdotransferase MoeA [Natranaerofaba carboxydovora]|uniref:molybdopterin molybdotransferase MoeA n=1 Tax=Natranaerofaba carboxydovora TaxID=2742683 RepID=UPI001F12D2FF|nr:molybdopterin molybdotransferase MoeA [Natranaerofaba carboxydovora]UMZ73198.1 Molybdopterin molybdenumtransferase [Natranaerofaba carboxydovora]
MIDPIEAYFKTMELVSNYISTQKVPIEEAVDYTLANDLIAKENIPSFERSPYDGYAFRAEETKNASKDSPVIFDIIMTLPAGCKPEKITGGKKAVKIMTGAALPEGYDCVIPFEKVKVEEDKVYLYNVLESGENVVPCGEDIEAGEFLFPAGKLLSSRDIGVISSLGYSNIEVIKPPKIGIIVTGNELVELDESLQKGEIRNSNRYLLTTSLKELNIENIKYYGIVEDTKENLKEVFTKAIEEVDMLLTTGGVSVGEYDLIPEVLEELGANRIFWKINARPGTPLHVAEFNKTPVFSLSGNPAALYASYKIYVERAILKMLGLIEGKDFYENAVKGFLGGKIAKKSVNQWRFLRARGYIEEGKFWCYETKKEKPGIISSLAISNGFILLKPGYQDLSHGDLVYFIPFDNDSGAKSLFT